MEGEAPHKESQEHLEDGRNVKERPGSSLVPKQAEEVM